MDEGRMTMYTTKTDIKKELREELHCPEKFIDTLNQLGLIDDLKKHLLQDSKSEVNDLHKKIVEEYKVFCKAHGLNVEDDNRAY